MRFGSSAAIAAGTGVAAIILAGIALPLQAAEGASPARGKPSPSPSPTPTAAPGPHVYFETAGPSSLNPTGPWIVVNAPLTSEGVAAGNYLVNATVVVSDPEDAVVPGSTVRCNLMMHGVESPTVYQFIPNGFDGAGTRATIPLQYAYSDVPAGAHVAVTCWVNGDADVIGADVSVLQVGSIN